MGTSIAATRFDTAAFSPRAQYEAWRQAVADIYETRRDVTKPSFAASMSAWHLGNTVVVRARADAQYFSRTPRVVAAGGLDHILVQVYARGECRGLYGDADSLTRPGDIKFIDQARLFASHNTDFENVTVAVPRQALVGLVADTDRLHGRVVPAEHPAAVLLGRHMLGLVAGAASLGPAEAAMAAEATRHLVAMAAGPREATRAETAEHTAAAVARLVRDFIDSRLDDPELSPELLARRFSLSRTQLYRLFAASGGVAAHIRARRLRATLRALQDPVQGGQPIGAIAFRYGFPSEAHFNRLFRVTFGETPGDVRAAARARAGGGAAGGGGTAECDLRAWLHALA